MHHVIEFGEAAEEDELQGLDADGKTGTNEQSPVPGHGAVTQTEKQSQGDEYQHVHDVLGEQLRVVAAEIGLITPEWGEVILPNSRNMPEYHSSPRFSIQFSQRDQYI